MAERKRIVLNCRGGYNFSAGLVIYILNIIRSFKLLEDSLRPHLIIIVSANSPIQEIKEIDYPYVEYYNFKPFKRTFIKLAINKIIKTIFGKYLIKRTSFPQKFDKLYPYFECEETFYMQKRMYWKPDFQEQYFPHYIPKAELDFVNSEMKKIASNKDYTLVLSSKNASDDFEKFFGPHVNETKLLRFISLIPDISESNPVRILKKYNITKKYFLVANQFWPHKNHILIAEAMKEVYKTNPDFQIVMTGKKTSYRDKMYLTKIEKFLIENGLYKNVKLTSFISREDQLVLMKNSMAVLQPSLFEGWSTVIEDCKALNHFVIASDLEVNKEQIDTNVLFFDKHDSGDLAKKMLIVLNNETKIVPYDYSKNIEQFKNDLVDVFELKK